MSWRPSELYEVVQKPDSNRFRSSIVAYLFCNICTSVRIAVHLISTEFNNMWTAPLPGARLLVRTVSRTQAGSPAYLPAKQLLVLYFWFSSSWSSKYVLKLRATSWYHQCELLQEKLHCYCPGFSYTPQNRRITFEQCLFFTEVRSWLQLYGGLYVNRKVIGGFYCGSMVVIYKLLSKPSVLQCWIMRMKCFYAEALTVDQLWGTIDS